MKLRIALAPAGFAGLPADPVETKLALLPIRHIHPCNNPAEMISWHIW